MLLEVHNLTVAYARGPVLSGLDLSLEAGELAVVFGQNGSGKSTLLKALAGLLPTSAGSILYQGEPVHQVPAWQRVDRGIAILLQSERVFPELDVRSNLEVAVQRLRDRREAKARVEQALSLTDIFRGRLREPAANLSGGEQQLLAVLRLVVLQGRLLLLDEPSTGLAPAMQEEVGELLRRLNAEGRTILMAEQNVDFARSLGRRFDELDAGVLRRLAA